MSHTRTFTSVLARSLAVACVALAIGLAFSSSAAAQSSGGGLRAGVSGDPDQFYFGGHFDTGFLLERLSFRPNVEVGLGDDITTVAANFEFVYWFPLSGEPWSIYTGGGPSLNVYEFNDNTETEPGFNLLVGIQHRRGIFAEFKLGLIDSPEVKFGIGFSF